MALGHALGAAVPRRTPYVYVTWVTKLLAGEASCEFAAWFKAHYQHEKLPSDFNLAQWKAEHAELVRRTAETLRADGYRVSVEDQNAFRVLSERGGFYLAGKPDVIAVDDARVLIVDCKTGAPRESDIVQAQVYQTVLGRMPVYQGLRIEGRVQYREHTVDVPAALDAAFLDRLRRIVTAVGSPQALPPVPSARECGWCDIGAADCAARQERVELPMVTNHGLF